MISGGGEHSPRMGGWFLRGCAHWSLVSSIRLEGVLRSNQIGSRMGGEGLEWNVARLVWHSGIRTRRKEVMRYSERFWNFKK